MYFCNLHCCQHELNMPVEIFADSTKQARIAMLLVFSSLLLLPLADPNNLLINLKFRLPFPYNECNLLR